MPWGMLNRRSNIIDRKRHKVLPQIKLSIIKTDDRAHTALILRDFIQHVKFGGHIRFGVCRHFDFNRVQNAVFENDQVNLPVDLNLFSILSALLVREREAAKTDGIRPFRATG